MAEGTTLGKAYVQILPSAKGIKDEIRKTMAPDMEAAGESFGKSIGSKIKSALVTAGIGMAIGKIFSSAISEGAKLQQSIGGIETLFKDSAGKMKQYADQAFKTAGMSANNYMEQATSFAAGLIKSCGGDTAKAADVANMAMIDMSDNMNKMGSNMEDIQNAYQGFAKGNYDMLDNLKLGYGGTKEEMQRLLDDAQKLTGVKYDISNLSDVYNAIHAIQEDIGITGTTAKEASTTFSGSFGQMKASAENLLGAMALGYDIEPQLKALAESAATFLFGNAIPMILDIVGLLPDAIGTMIKEAGPIIAAKGPEIVEDLGGAIDFTIQWLIRKGPELAKSLWNGLINTLNTLIPQIAKKGKEIVEHIGQGLGEQIPQLKGVFDNLIPIIESVGAAFLTWKAGTIIGTISTKIGDATTGAKLFLEVVKKRGIIDGFAGALVDSGGKFAGFGQKVIMAGGGLKGLGTVMLNLCGGPIGLIIGAIAAAVAAVVYFYNTNEDFRNFVNQCWESIKKACGDLCKAIADFFGELPAKIGEIWNNITTSWNNFAKGCQDLWNGMCQGITDTWNNFATSCQQLWSDFAQGCTDIWNNICSTVTGIWDGFVNICKTVWDTIVGVIKFAGELIFALVEAWFQIITLPFRFIWENCKGIVIEVWNIIVEWLSTTWNNISTTCTNVFNAIKDFFSGVWQAIHDKIIEIWTIVTEWISTTWDSIKAKCEAVFNPIRDFLAQIWQAIHDKAIEIWTIVTDWIKAKWTDLQTRCQAVFDAIKNFLSSTWTNIQATITNVWNAITGWISGIWNNIKGRAEAIFGAIRDTISNAWQAVSNRAHQIWDSFTGWISGMWSSIQTTASNIWNGIKNAITGPIEQAKNIIGGILDTIRSWFAGFSIQLPHIALPHFSVSPPGWTIGDLLKGSVPHLGISWYAKAMDKGMILDKPTIFGEKDGRLLGGGEAGAEAVVGVSSLQRMIQRSVETSSRGFDYERLAAEIKAGIEELEVRLSVKLDSRILADELAKPLDKRLNRLAGAR